MTRSPYVWDYEVDDEQFREMLAGRLTLGRLGQDWAVGRLLEYAPYKEIISVLGFPVLLEGWPRWRARVKSLSRQRGFDFLVQWVREHHPELLEKGDHGR